MTDTRFPWDRADKLAGALELKRRNFWRRITKDAGVNCWICGKKPKRHDLCYYPAAGVAKTNTVIAHKEEVERYIDECAAKGVTPSIGVTAPKTTRAAAHNFADGAAQKRKLEGRVDNAGELPPSTIEELKASVAKFKEVIKEKLHANDFERGYTAGYREAWAEIQEVLGK